MPQIVTLSSLIATLEAASATQEADRARVLAFHAEMLGRPAAPDLPAIAARHLAPGFVLRGGPAVPETGGQGLVALLQRLGRAVPDFGAEVQEALQARDRWVVRSILFGTPIRPVPGLAPAGQSFAIQAIHIHRLADGRIAETWHAGDATQSVRQGAGH